MTDIKDKMLEPVIGMKGKIEYSLGSILPSVFRNNSDIPARIQDAFNYCSGLFGQIISPTKVTSK